MAAAKKRREPRFRLLYVLLCEEVRPEIGAKMSLLGFYGGDRIIIGADAVTLGGLAFVFCLEVLRGEQPQVGTFSLEGPAGQLAIPGMTMSLTGGSQRRKNVVIQTNGLNVEVGTYKATLKIENEEFSAKFGFECNAEFISRLTAMARGSVDSL